MSKILEVKIQTTKDLHAAIFCFAGSHGLDHLRASLMVDTRSDVTREGCGFFWGNQNRLQSEDPTLNEVSLSQNRQSSH
jgi:hypothetical protein